MSCVDEIVVSFAGMQTIQLSAQKGILIHETKIELDSHAYICVVADQCLLIHDHNKPVNVFGYYPKVKSKHACIVDAAVAYDAPKTGQVVKISNSTMQLR